MWRMALKSPARWMPLQGYPRGVGGLVFFLILAAMVGFTSRKTIGTPSHGTTLLSSSMTMRKTLVPWR